MSSDDGREELARGSFDVDRTMERVLEVRRSGSSPLESFGLQVQARSG